jgi:hypothetical protein
MEEPAPTDVEWLAETATGDDRDRAAWELRYLRRALGLIVAQRDALDDRTASAVAHELTAEMAKDRNVAAPLIRLAERQFNDRLSAYREMIALRGTAESLPERIGRTLLLMSGAGRMAKDDLERAAILSERYVLHASERLRAAFGAATLPDTETLRDR